MEETTKEPKPPSHETIRDWMKDLPEIPNGTWSPDLFTRFVPEFGFILGLALRVKEWRGAYIHKRVSREGMMEMGERLVRDWEKGVEKSPVIFPSTGEQPDS